MFSQDQSNELCNKNLALIIALFLGLSGILLIVKLHMIENEVTKQSEVAKSKVFKINQYSK